MLESDILRKVCIPYQPQAVLRRQSLIALLNDTVSQATSSAVQEGSPDYRVVLLCAPSGYGKTTTLIDFAQQSPISCCWYELDCSVNDKITFLEYLIASLRQCFPSIAPGLDMRLLESATGHININELIDDVLTAMRQEITQHYVLIISNFHEVNNNAEILNVVNFLLHQLPETCLLVIESRALPKLDLVPLLARREVLTIDKDLLRFTAQEILQLSELRGLPITLDEAEYLAQTFDGWIAGILLGTRLGTHDAFLARIISQQGSVQPLLEHNRQSVFAYMVDEVFKREPEVYGFLKEAAILRWMEPAFCDELLQCRHSAQTLAYLEQQGLFVTRANHNQQSLYICHPVLREVLSQELKKRDPERFIALHRRAANLYQETHEYVTALYHASLAQDYEYVADLIIAVSEQEFKRGHIETIERWINELPAHILRSNARLQIILANVYLWLGNAAAASPLLQSASKLLQNQVSDDTAIEQLRIEIDLARSKVSFFEGNYEQARALCLRTLEKIPTDEVVLRAEAYLRLGMCSQMLGDFADCIRELQQALRLLGYDIESYQTARLHSHLANTYGLLGNLPLSEHHRTRALHCLEHLRDERGKANNLIGMGVTLQRYGSYEEAERMLNEALQTARGPIKFQRAEGYALVSLGDVYQEQDKYDQALLVMEEGLRVAYQLGDQYLINYTHSTLAMNYLLMGDPHTALLLVSNNAPPDKTKAHLTYGETLSELTRGTVMLQQQRYQEALTCLQRVEEVFNTTGYKRERLQALIRLAGCYYAVNEAKRAQELLQSAQVLAVQERYETLARVEISHMLQLMSRHDPQLISGLARMYKHLLQTLNGDEEKDPVPQEFTAELVFVDNIAEDLPAPAVPAPAASVPVAVTEVVHPPSLQEATPVEKTHSSASEHSIGIRALGEPTILLDDEPVTRWRVTRVMELCFYLLDRAKPVHKEQIMLDLWPESESSTDQSLRSIVYYLRKTLGERCISYRSGYYKLELEQVYGRAVYYDVERFEHFYAEGREAMEQEEYQLAYSAFQQMVQLYRGDYVQSFYRDWCAARRDALRLAYVDARRQLATITWQDEEYQECIQHWQHILSVDNCNEDAHYGLMCAYIKLGQRNLALRQYQRCVTALREELNVEPRQSIQHLYQRLTRKTTGI